MIFVIIFKLASSFCIYISVYHDIYLQGIVGIDILHWKVKLSSRVRSLIACTAMPQTPSVAYVVNISLRPYVAHLPSSPHCVPHELFTNQTPNTQHPRQLRLGEDIAEEEKIWTIRLPKFLIQTFVFKARTLDCFNLHYS